VKSLMAGHGSSIRLAPAGWASKQPSSDRGKQVRVLLYANMAACSSVERECCCFAGRLMYGGATLCFAQIDGQIDLRAKMQVSRRPRCGLAVDRTS
jgi:hypothetical protein